MWAQIQVVAWRGLLEDTGIVVGKDGILADEGVCWGPMDKHGNASLLGESD